MDSRLIVPLAAVFVVLGVVGCGGDDDAQSSPTSQPSATSVPTRTAIGPTPVPTQTVVEPTPSPQPTKTPRQVTGLFVEPRPSDPDTFVDVASRPASPFEPWDRESLVVYDVQNMTEINFGPALRPRFSPDVDRMAYNVARQVRIIDLSTGALQQEINAAGGVGSFIDNDHLYLPSSGPDDVYDLNTGERIREEDLSPELRAKLQQARGSGGRVIEGGRYQLIREAHRPGPNRCQTDPDPAVPFEVCDAELFEQWTLEEIATGEPALAFRAYKASSAGPGELIVATSPQCDSPDGAKRWCPKVLEELRADDPEDEFPYEEAHGTTNIFIVSIETGEAEFIATATFTPDTRVRPENWPLIANQDHIAWTESYCSGGSPGNTRIYDRVTGEITELDTRLWVTFTPTGDLGVDPFGPKAILDIEEFKWGVVLPEAVTDVAESPDGRYLAVGGVLGHGGLCG